MKLSLRAGQQGFLLITVVLVLAVLAAMALMLTSGASLDNALVAKHTERANLGYAAEAGLKHAQWQLAQHGHCGGYKNLPVTSFGTGNYSATVTPKGDSPVAITATGALANGTTRSLTRDAVKVYYLETPQTLILQPGSEGKDGFIEGESGKTTLNNGNHDELKTSSLIGKEYRTLLQFDLAAVPATAMVQTATLELYLQSVGSADVVKAHRVLRDWDENRATWEYSDGVILWNYWNTPGGDYDPVVAGSFLAASTGLKSMDITAVAAAWVSGSQPNHGLLLRSDPSASGNENKYHSSDKAGEPHPKLTLTYVCECGTACAGSAAGDTVVLSTSSAAMLGGLDFDDIDLADYDPASDTATLLFEGDLTTIVNDIDAVHVLDNGHIVLSAKSDDSLGGLSFGPADLVEYDPTTDTATLYFDGSAHFASPLENITSVHILNNGNLVLSTADYANLGGLDFSDQDLVEYDPTSSTASIYFDGDATALSQDITAVHVLENGHLVMAAKGATTLGGLSFTAADLIEYDIATDTATLYFDGSSLFSDPSEQIMSVHINGDSGPAVAAANYLDQFNAQTYSGSDGTLTWSTDWLEVGESNGPTLGDEQVLDDSGIEFVLRVRDNDNGGEGVRREADLSSCATATLKFNYRRKEFVDTANYVAVDVSADGGSTWTEVDRLQGSTDDTVYQSASYDISAYMAANTQIRFLTAPTLDNSDKLFIDNVEIVCP